MTPEEAMAIAEAGESGGGMAEQAMSRVEKAMAMAEQASSFDSMSREEKKRFLDDKYRKEDARTGLSENTSDNFFAGVGSGMMSVAQGVGNMFGIVDDETVMNKKYMDAEGGLSDDTAGSVGQFVGEVAALAPVGVVGKGAQLASQGLNKARMLPTVARILGGRAAPVVAEGAIAGATLANPNERGGGAAIGATTGAILKMATSGVGRIFNRGLVKTNPTAKRLSETIRESTGRTPFIPLRQAMDPQGGGLSDAVAGVHNIAGMLPSARARLQTQSNQLALDAYDMNIRKAFNPLKGPRISETLKESGGDIQKTIELAARNSSGRRAPYSPYQQMFADMSERNFKGQYTPTQLYQASQKMMPTDAELHRAPFRQIAMDMKDILEKPSHTSDVATRDVYHTLGNNLNALPSVMPGLGSFVGSRTFQNFLMGNTALQRGLQKALEQGSAKQFTAVIQHIERAIAAQPAIDDEANDFGNTLQGYGSFAREALVGLGE